MMTKSGGGRPLAVAAAVLMLLLLLWGDAASAAASCNAKQLSSCVPALTTGVAPTAECCSGMKAQQGCLCQFAKNPAYARYVNGPNARRTVTACGIALPHC